MILKGFTLIELLIVIAILGVLATVAVIIMDPFERLASSKDAGRISTVAQLGGALETYYVSRSEFPDTTAWGADMVATGHPRTFPPGITYLAAYGITPCTTNALPGANPTYCYDLDTIGDDEAVIFAILEAEAKRNLCGVTESVYFVYSSADGRAGTVCSENDPLPGNQTFLD